MHLSFFKCKLQTQKHRSTLINFSLFSAFKWVKNNSGKFIFSRRFRPSVGSRGVSIKIFKSYIIEEIQYWF